MAFTSITVYVGNGTRQAHSYNGSLIENRRYLIDSCHFRWPWVTLKGWTLAAICSADLRMYTRTVWPTATKFGRRQVNQCGRVCFRISHISIRRDGAQRSHIWEEVGRNVCSWCLAPWVGPQKYGGSTQWAGQGPINSVTPTTYAYSHSLWPMRTGCSKAEPKIFAPPQTPSWRCGTAKINQLEMVTTVPLPTNPFWWGSMHAISSYCGNRPTNPVTDRTDYNTLRCS